MRLFRRLLPLLTLLVLAAPAARAQQRLTRQQEKNLVAFARLYGYVQYFHPSDEAQQPFWPMLAIAGSKQMLSVENDDELVQELNKLFRPLGPTIQVFPTKRPQQFDPATLLPPAGAGATKVVSWQHRGLYTGTVAAFHNVRLNRPAAEVASKDEFAYNFLQDIDISRFAGLPYEVDVVVREKKKSAAGFALEFRQFLVGQENSRATQRFLNQQATAQGKTYTCTGTVGATAQSLDFIITLPNTDSFSLDFNVDVFVLVDGKKVALPKTKRIGIKAADKQKLTLKFSSANELAEPLFSEQLHLGDYLAREVVPGISCIVPLALAGDAAHTYPVSDSVLLRQLGAQPARWEKPTAEWERFHRSAGSLALPEVRLAGIVTAWNALRHGYAYWSSASATPDALLRQALRSACQDATPLAFSHTLQRLLAPLNDGHGFVISSLPQPDSLSVPLYFGKVEGRVVVTRVLDPALSKQVRPGDIVLALNGVATEKALRKRASLISGSPQNNEYRALLQLGNGPATQLLDLKLRRARTTWHLRLPRTTPADGYRAGSQVAAQLPNGWLTPGIYYYNLATLKTSLSSAEYQTLAQAKAVIFDIRCYPSTGIYSLVPPLLSAPGKVSLFASLNMLRPDQEDVRYAPGADYYAPGPQHLPGKMYFLTDAVTQSLPEGFLGVIRGLGLGTLVGRPTSGANGVVNMVVLPGGFTISYSGMRVLNADGSRHHAIGIQPDVLVMPTLESVQLGEDAILTTALKLAQAAP